MAIYQGNITDAVRLYALFKARTAYAGSCIRVRRSNDNSEADIGFDGDGNLDLTALATHVGANSGFIVTWYDQSTSAVNATQATTANQPRIVNAGTVETVNGLPSSYFDGTNDSLIFTNVSPTDWSAFGVAKRDSIGDLLPVIAADGTNSGALFAPLWSNNLRYVGRTTGVGANHRYVRPSSSTSLSTALEVSEGYTISGVCSMYVDGSSISMAAESISYTSSYNGFRTLGVYSASYAKGHIAIAILFSSDKTADRADIYEDLRSYYFDTAVTPEQVATPAPTATIPTVSVTAAVTDVTPEQVATPPPTATIPTIDTFTNTDLTATNVATPTPTATTPTITTAGGQQVVAFGEFVSDLGREWRVEIYDGEAAVSYPETDTLRLLSDGFQLSYESPNDDIHEVIKASKLTPTIVVESTDTDTISMVTDIAQAEEGRFYMILKEWDGDSWEWYWWGQVVTDNIKEPDKWPSQIELTAIDGLGLLQNVNYNPLAGGLFSGLDTFGEIIAKLIYRVKQGEEMRGTDHFIKLATNWYNLVMTDTNRDPMTYTYIRQEAFWQEEDREGQTTLRPSKGNDVADAVFFGWNARIMLAKGYYHVEQVPLYGSDTILRTIVDKDGAYVSRTGESVEKEIDQINMVSTHGGYREWARPLKAARRIHLHNGSNNILSPSDDNYETAVAFPASALPLQTDVVAEPKRLSVRFLVRVRITNRTGSAFTSANYITLRNELKLSDGVSNNVYLFKPAIQDQMSLINTQAEYNFRVGPFTAIPATEQKDFVRFVEYDTPTFVGDDFDSNTFKLDFGSQTANANSALFWLNNNIVATSVYTNVAEADWTADPYDVAYNNKIVVQFKCVSAQVIFEDGSSNEKEYVATNSTTTSTLEYDYPVEIPFGDIVNHKVEPGAFRIWNGSAYVTNQNGWGIGGPIDPLTHDQAFHDIAVQEAAGIRHIPRDRQYFDIYGVIDPVNCLAYQGGRYAFVGGTFAARADRWTGFWQYVGVDTTSMQVSGDDIVMEPSFGFTNGAVVNGFYDNILNGTLIAVTEAPVSAGTITTIPIVAPGHDGIKDDMTIIVTDPTVPISVKFVVDGDVDAADTSITVDSQLLGIDLGTGSYITIDPVSTATAIGAIYDGTFIGSLEYWAEGANTASPNDSIPAHIFIPKVSGDADTVMEHRGTGSFLRDIPTGDATGGNKRGSNAVDFQVSRINADEIASGTQAFIGNGTDNKASGNNSAVLNGVGNDATGQRAVILNGAGNVASAGDSTVLGGSNNTASGTYSAILGGAENTASGQSSAALGEYALADKHGQVAFGGFRFAVDGDSNCKMQPLGRVTTNATPAVLTADGGTPASTNTITIASGEVYSFMIMVQGIDTSTKDVVAQVYMGVCQNNAGTTSIQANNQISSVNNIGGTSDIVITDNDTDDRLDITVTGVAATTIRWNAYVQLLKIAT